VVAIATKSSVYLETSFIGYLASRPSRDLITAANQQLTHEWWNTQRSKYELVIATPVLAECGRGDPAAADERLLCLAGIPVLDVTADVNELAARLVAQVPLPPQAKIDALHIAVAAMHKVPYLLTWNCAHIANAALFHRRVCRQSGAVLPVVCTPQQLMEGS
jgi:hypothetical protein